MGYLGYLHIVHKVNSVTNITVLVIRTTWLNNIGLLGIICGYAERIINDELLMTDSSTDMK